MVSMARKTGFTTGNVSCYYSIASTMNFFAIASRRATAPFVVDVSRLKPLAAPALTEVFELPAKLFQIKLADTLETVAHCHLIVILQMLVHIEDIFFIGKSIHYTPV